MAKKSARELQKEIWQWKKDYWERLRRNPSYRAAYENYVKAQQGPANIRECGEKYHRIVTGYWLNSPIDPQQEFDDSVFHAITNDQGLIRIPRSCVSISIRREDFLFATGARPFPQSDRPYRRAGDKTNVLFEGKYLRVLVKAEMPDKLCGHIVTKAVRIARDVLKQQLESEPRKSAVERLKKNREEIGRTRSLTTKDNYLVLPLDVHLPLHLVQKLTTETARLLKRERRYPSVRKRFMENESALKAWDMRQSGEKYTVIAATLFPTDDAKSPESRAKKAVGRARQLIQSVTRL